MRRPEPADRRHPARRGHRTVHAARAAERSAARARLGLEDDDLVVVSVSRLVPRKGMDTLIRAGRPPATTVPGAAGPDRGPGPRPGAARPARGRDRRPRRVPRLRPTRRTRPACSAAPTCSPCCAATAGAASSRRASASCSPRRPRAGSPRCADARAARTRRWSTSRPGSSSNGPRRSTTPSSGPGPAAGRCGLAGSPRRRGPAPHRGGADLRLAGLPPAGSAGVGCPGPAAPP